MKSIMLFLLAAFSMQVAVASDINIIVPNPAGSSADVVARTMASEYNRITGRNIAIEYAPGGDHVIAVQKFKDQRAPTLLIGTSTMHVFNHVFKPSINYSDQDFDHIAWIGWSPNVWYVKNDSPIKNLNDLLNRLAQDKVTIGVDALSVEVNAISVVKHHKHGKNVTVVKYKGSPQTLTDVMGGHIEVGIGSLSSLIVGAAEAKNIRILGSTLDHTATIAGTSVPPAAPVLKVPQFNGAFLISITPGQDPAKVNAIKKDIIAAIRSPEFKNQMAKIQIEVDVRDGSFPQNTLTSYRDHVRKLK